jgi:NCAIR mutase (PurE)-related protein
LCGLEVLPPFEVGVAGVAGVAEAAEAAEAVDAWPVAVDGADGVLPPPVAGWPGTGEPGTGELGD